MGSSCGTCKSAEVQISEHKTRHLDLSHFAYSQEISLPKPTSVALREFPRKLSEHPRKEVNLPIFTSKGVKRPKHSPGIESQSERENSSQSPKKKKRSYATPETYAHLPGLQDCLKDELDVMFCGINPGHMSATTGHHFANPTNHFWKCLHGSTLTTRRLSPSEDFTLPDMFSLGLTNLVERPTAEQAELSHSEMTIAVPTLLTKVARYRPRFVCFVGVGIWRTVEKILMKTGPNNTNGHTPNPAGSSKTDKGCVTRLGLQPYKLVYDIKPSEQIGQSSSVRETLFFVVPSTSGRVVSHQLPDKIKLFIELKAAIDDYQHAKFDTSQMAAITVASIEGLMSAR